MKVLVVGSGDEIQLAAPELFIGPKGVDGRDGRDGKDGFNGRDGSNGRDGAPGIGVRGPKGDRGLPGERGFRGKDGKDGVSLMGPQGFPGLDGLHGRDGKDGKNFVFPEGQEGQVWTETGSGPNWQYPAPGGFSRVWKNSVEQRLNGATSVDLSAYVTSLSAAATYQVKGSYANSVDVSSFYALKTSIPSVAGFANSLDVASFYALKTSLAIYATSSDVSSIAGTITSKAFAMTAAAIRF